MVDVIGTNGDDTLDGGSGGDDSYRALAGDDIIFDFGGGDTFDGGTGTDTLILDPEGQLSGVFLTDLVFDVEVNLTNGTQSDGGIAGDADTLRSIENYTHLGKFNMTVTGDEGDNVIVTDEGTDVLQGRGGFDTLTGGAGEDRFEFPLLRGGSTDTITDFEPGVDVLAFSAGALRGNSSLSVVDGDGGAEVIWSPSAKAGGAAGITVAVLEGVSASDVSMDDFVFDL